ncbi:hypothetical protein [Planotetraspora kaengkrachanensis]|uniref:HNH endonuclease n=1 Tax=Planotetraspora kaengkrachanensis TaxID=575193 RepID=A0A8J3LUY7_9ACTN|nr:hypothetical protein [Planotetraspora kaengkrachanensis]GIG79598.1 hypothetical protein Pka01_27250 [Planotetraspora kaengkrachanensis]
MPSKGRGGHAYRRLIAQVKAGPEDWTCCRCRLPIDPAIPWPDKRCWSLDHLDELALGGSLLDPANAAAAHFDCNSRAGRALQDLMNSQPIQSRAW